MKTETILKYPAAAAIAAAFLLHASDAAALYTLNDDLLVTGEVTIEESLEVQGDDGVLFTGTYGQGVIPAEGSGVRMMWYPGKAAFRAGRDANGSWDDANIGDYSVAFGDATVASGNYSAAFGQYTQASGTRSMAFGSYVFAIGWDSLAGGFESAALGGYSIAIGESAYADGPVSAAFGKYTTASGAQSTATGFGTLASGDSSAAFGRNTKAESYGSVAIGRYNVGGFNSPNGDTQWDPGDPVFEIGIGEDTNNRANAMTVYKNGSTELNGNLDVVGHTTIAGDLTVEGNLVSDINMQDDLHIGGQVRAQDRISAEVTNGQDLVTVLAANNDGANAAGTGVRMALSNSSSGLETLVRGGTIDAVRQADGSNDLIFSSGTGSALNEILRLKGANQSTVIQGDTEIDGDLKALNGKLTHADRHSYTHRFSSTKSADTLVKLGEFTMPLNNRQVFFDGYVTTGTGQIFEKERFSFQFRRQGDANTYNYSFRKEEFSGHTGVWSDRINLEFFSDDTNPTRVVVAARYKTSNQHLFAHYDILERGGRDIYIQASQHSPEILAADAAEYSAFLNNHTQLDPTGGVQRIDGKVEMSGEVTIAHVPPQGGILMGEFGN